jgi:hypothetical protein
MERVPQVLLGRRTRSGRLITPEKSNPEIRGDACVGIDRAGTPWVVAARGSILERWRSSFMVLSGILLALAIGFSMGHFWRSPETATEPVTPESVVQSGVASALIKTAKAEALMDFARDQATRGRLQIARLAYEQVLALADEATSARAKRELEELKARARDYERFLNERSYALFAKGLNESSNQVNGCHFHGVMYSCTRQEARALFARYLPEYGISPALQANIGYPLFYWGENHGNLQWGLAQAVADVLAERAEGGQGMLIAAFKENSKLQGTLQIGFGYLRRIAGENGISAPDKGRIYWRLSEALSLLTRKETEQTPPSMKDFLGDLKNTISPFAAHKDLVQPSGIDPEVGDVF